MLLVFGAAVPRWGLGDRDGVALGRDVVLMIDLSRSMRAEDMSGQNARWQAAVEAAGRLVQTLRQQGGHRVGLIIFAARPQLIVPLTTDFDHVDAKLRELDGQNPPPGVRALDDSRSGTRIGSAIAAAVAAHDFRFPGCQDIVLFSDGDDPVDDREWSYGISASRQAGVPVHAFGIGDPDPKRAVPVLIDGQFLEFAEKDGLPDQVRSYLHEDVMKSIAREGRGTYLSAQTDLSRVEEPLRELIGRERMRNIDDDSVPQLRDRSLVFLMAGLTLLVLGWLREKRP
jgi:Ca-activated chloride channel family protein